MDLETIIPLVIVAVVYLFKAFENARKGDQKKRRSAPKQPQGGRKKTAPEKPPVSGRSLEAPRTPERPNIPEIWKTPEAPGSRETSVRPAIPVSETPSEGQWWWDEAPSPIPAADTTAHRRKTEPASKTEPTQGWQSLKKSGRKKQSSAGIPSPPMTDPEAGESNDYADFDLEDAVIKAVILERREF